MPKLGHLLGEGLAQAFEGPLRRVVGAEARERADPTDGGDLDDVAGALLTQVGQGGLGDPDGAEDVRLELGAQLGPR